MVLYDYYKIKYFIPWPTIPLQKGPQKLISIIQLEIAINHLNNIFIS